MTRAASIYGFGVGLAIALGAIASTWGGVAAPSKAAGDPIADDVARWKRYLAEDTVTVGFVAQVKRSAAPALDAAEDALAKGRRSFALLRLGNVRSNLE